MAAVQTSISFIVPFENHENHIIFLVGDLRVVCDTGSPISVCKRSPVEFLGTSHILPTHGVGVSSEKLTEFLKTQIDGLFGVDLLSLASFVHFDLQRKVVIFSPQDPILSSDSMSHFTLPLTFIMDIPMLSVQVASSSACAPAFFDTGASLSYVLASFVHGQTPIRRQTDFHPSCGRFEVDVYEVVFCFGDRAQVESVKLECGVLPEPLLPLLTAVKAVAIIGNDLLSRYRVSLSWQHAIIRLDSIGANPSLPSEATAAGASEAN
jgi:hypothetical protein